MSGFGFKTVNDRRKARQRAIFSGAEKFEPRTLKFLRRASGVALHVSQYSGPQELSVDFADAVKMLAAISAPLSTCAISGRALFVGDAVFHVTPREAKLIAKTFGVRS